MAPKPKPKGGGLAKKVGPLPLWAWAVIVLAVVGFFFLRSRGASAGSAGDIADGGPLASGGGSGPAGGASGGGGDDGQGNVIIGTNPTGATGNGSAPNSGATSFASTDPGSGAPTSSFDSFQTGGEVAGVAANAPVSSAQTAPGSDAYSQGVQSHPGAYAPAAGGYVPANYAALNTPTAQPTNAHRPGFQI